MGWLTCVVGLTIIILLGLGARSDAQVLYGKLVGVVTDNSGAVIPDANVIAMEIATNTTLTTKSDKDGGYIIPDAPPGTYRISISKYGFQTSVTDDISLLVNSSVRVDAKLAVGAKSETITVNASSAAQLQTEQSDVHVDVSSEELQNLPVPVRAYQGLLATLPGAGPMTGGTGGTNNPTKSMSISFNGEFAGYTTYRIEGVGANDAWIASDSTARPSAEAIQTMNVVTGAADVEQGIAAGTLVNVTLKSGTNDMHSEVYWFHTDQDLAAQYYLAPPGSKKNQAIENDIGGTLGGPILKNKLFYFVSYEGDFTRTKAPVVDTVPLPSVLAGNFQPLLSSPSLPNTNPDPTNPANCYLLSPAGYAYGCIFDPLTGNADGTGRTPFVATPATNPQCTSGDCYNMIPTNRMSEINSKLLALVPQPTVPGAVANNFVGEVPTAYNLNLIDAKVDWNATSKLRVSGRFEYDPYSDNQIPAFPAELGDNATTPDQHGNVSAATASFSYVPSSSFVVDAGFGFTRSKQILIPVGGNSKATLDGLGIKGTNNGALPYSGGLAAMKIGCNIFYDGSFCGGQYTGYGEGYNYLEYLDPVYSYFANFTKLAGKHTVKFGINVFTTHMQHAETGPDTISYDGGVTLDADPGQFPINAGQTNLYSSYADFELGMPTSWLTHQINTIGGQKLTNLLAKSFSAYVGDTWKPFDNLTIGYGTGWEYYPVPTHGNHGLELFLPQPGGTGTYEVCGYGGIPLNCGIQVSKKLFTPRAGFAYRITNDLVVRGGYSVAIDPYNMARDSIENTPEVLNYTASEAGVNPYTPIGSIEVGIPTPTPIDYHTGIISPLPPGFNMGTIASNVPINYVRGYLQSYNLTVQKTFGAWSAQMAYVGNHSVHGYSLGNFNYCAVGDTSPTCYQYYSVFKNLTQTQEGHDGTVHYNGLQAILVHEFRHGMMISANYTYSQSRSFGSNTPFGSGNPINDPNFSNLNMSISPYDETHTFHLTGVVSSPFGRGQMFMKDGGFGAAVLGGWQLNGVLVRNTGLPLTISAGNVTFGNAQRASYAPGVTKGSVSYPRQFNKWFDPADFVVNASHTTFGNVPFDSLRAPGATNLDLSLFREVPTIERIKAQIRMEAFNITNTPHWGSPNMTYGSPAFGAISSVTPVNRLVDQRFLRLGLKFMF